MILALVETYQEEENPEISLEHRKLLDQRLADHIADPEAGKDWKILKSGLHKKYGLNKGVSGKPLMHYVNFLISQGLTWYEVQMGNKKLVRFFKPVISCSFFD